MFSYTFEESNKLIFNSSTDVLFDIDLVTEKVIISDAYEKLFGYTVTGNVMTLADWAKHIHPDDIEEARKDNAMMFASDVMQRKPIIRLPKYYAAV